ncbi:MAG TPA: ABC transporter permease [Micromonosporaceae bacterium]
MVTLLLGSRLVRNGVVRDAACHARGGVAVMTRNAYVHRSNLVLFLSGLVEPFLYLLSLGVGMGQLVGEIPYAGGTIAYPVYVAPAMLAAAAMTGAVTESTYNFFAKLKFMKLYESMVATPVTPLGIVLGEIAWALLRGAVYAGCFVVIMSLMGLAPSWWVVLALPAAVLIGLAFAAAGLAFSTYLRSWQDFDYVTVAIFLLFLFSATFAPLDAYPGWLRAVVAATPLYHGVSLVRGLSTGAVSVGLLWHVAYLVGLTVVGLAVTSRRVRRLVTP